MYLNQSDVFRQATTPPAWLEKGKPKAEPVPAGELPRPDERITPKRKALMEQGLIELENWLLDLVRQGLASARPQLPEMLGHIATRLVDSQLGGIARRLRVLSTRLVEIDWQEIVLEELAELYLLIQAFKRRTHLSKELQEELFSLVGVNIKKELVLQQKGVEDQWLVIGKREGVEEKLNYRRTWFWGINTKKTALLLDFAWGDAGYPLQWKVGSLIKGTFVYYPGAWPQRALVQQFEPTTADSIALNGHEDFESFANEFANAISVNPWLGSFPALLDSTIPVFESSKPLIIDQKKKQLPLSPNQQDFWTILAVSAGNPISLFGEWVNNAFQPLSIIAQNRVIPMTSAI